MTIERKVFPLSGASIDAAGALDGHAAVFGNRDDGGDIVLPGFFAGVLDEFLATGFMSWSHDWHTPIGIPTSAVEDAMGLHVTASFHSDPESQRYRTIAAERLAAGKTMGLSIGYEVAPGGAERTAEARLLRKASKLFEFSLVMVPMNALAGAAAVKGGNAPAGTVAQASYCLLTLNRLIESEGRDAVDGDVLVGARDWLLALVEASGEVGSTVDLEQVRLEAEAEAPAWGYLGRPVPFADHLASVTAAVKAAATRSRGVARLRKEGRVLSSDNRSRLEVLLEQLAAAGSDIADLLASTDPDTAQAALAAEAEYLLREVAARGDYVMT
jgi:Escherichia/Staphylococcus phage prohead protease